MLTAWNTPALSARGKMLETITTSRRWVYSYHYSLVWKGAVSGKGSFCLEDMLRRIGVHRHTHRGALITQPMSSIPQITDAHI